MEIASMKANSLIEQIRRLTVREPETVPAGWKTVREWSLQFGIKRRATDVALAKAVRAGIAERKVFQVERQSRMRGVAHYRQVKSPR